MHASLIRKLLVVFHCHVFIVVKYVTCTVMFLSLTRIVFHFIGENSCEMVTWIKKRRR